MNQCDFKLPTLALIRVGSMQLKCFLVFFWYVGFNKSPQEEKKWKTLVFPLAILSYQSSVLESKYLWEENREETNSLLIYMSRKFAPSAVRIINNGKQAQLNENIWILRQWET